MTDTSVSYTHLDVYKRQGQNPPLPNHGLLNSPQEDQEAEEKLSCSGGSTDQVFQHDALKQVCDAKVTGQTKTKTNLSEIFQGERPAPKRVKPNRSFAAAACSRVNPVLVKMYVRCIGHLRLVLPSRQNIKAKAVELPGVLEGVLLVSAYKPTGDAILDVGVNPVLAKYYIGHHRLVFPPPQNIEGTASRSSRRRPIGFGLQTTRRCNSRRRPGYSFQSSREFYP